MFCKIGEHVCKTYVVSVTPTSLKDYFLKEDTRNFFKYLIAQFLDSFANLSLCILHVCFDDILFSSADSLSSVGLFCGSLSPSRLPDVRIIEEKHAINKILLPLPKFFWFIFTDEKIMLDKEAFYAKVETTVTLIKVANRKTFIKGSRGKQAVMTLIIQ